MHEISLSLGSLFLFMLNSLSWSIILFIIAFILSLFFILLNIPFSLNWLLDIEVLHGDFLNIDPKGPLSEVNKSMMLFKIPDA